MNRRGFLAGVAGTGFASSVYGRNGLSGTDKPSAAEKSSDRLVRFSSDIEPVVRLLEQTPREKVFEAVAQELRGGLSYQRLLSALFLAGIRNVNPQPPGFKFHCVFVIHAAHQLAMAGPHDQRWLPLFWALDDFKNSQEKDQQEGDFSLERIQGKLPSAGRAWDEFHAAMENWDEQGADRAAAVLYRTRGAHEIIEGLWRYGARDYRNIGHKPIFVANGWRTLQTIGWRHAEPVLRSLVLGLLDFGKTERVNQYAFEDQCYLRNRELVGPAIAKLPADWAQVLSIDPTVDDQQDQSAVTLDLLQMIREQDFAVACPQALKLLLEGKARAPAVWDAVHLAAGELMMRQPGIYGIHTVTSVNGLRYAFHTASRDENRLLMLLQGVGWMCQFTRFMSQVRGGLNAVKITDLTPADSPSSSKQAAEETFAVLTTDPIEASRRAFAFSKHHTSLGHFGGVARSLIAAKTTEVHGFKYPAAIFEDWNLVSRQWRPHLLAAAVYYLPGSDKPDAPVVQRAREALKEIG